MRLKLWEKRIRLSIEINKGGETMSTRSNIIVRNGDERMIFFSRYNGYPSCLGKSLKQYLDRINGWSLEKIAKKLSDGIKD